MTGTDDVSTMSDPVYPPGLSFGKQTYADTDSITGKYDYSKMYGGIGEMNSTSSSAGASTNITGSSRSQTTTTSTSVRSFHHQDSLRSNDLFSEEASFDEQFVSNIEQYIEICAPPGKLGMVVDSMDDDVPMVHALRENSILMDKIRIGDKLISVDGEDTTGMTPREVSDLITEKSSNKVRILVFARSGGNGRDNL